MNEYLNIVRTRPLLEAIRAFDVAKVRYEDVQRTALVAAPAPE